MSSQPRLYAELASWFHLLTAPEEYLAEADQYRRVLQGACEPPPRTVLELGSGGGNNASHMKRHFEMTLVDLSPRMLSVSRGLNPECEHVEGDMRTIRLGRTFDAVFVHDAVSYLTTEEALRAAMTTAYIHCRPGGAALFAPDYVRETLGAPRVEHGGHDGEGRALRYLMWTWDPDPEDSTYVADFAYLLRDAHGKVTVEHDRHLLGVFSRATWLGLLRERGFRPEVVRAEHGEGVGTELFVGAR